jgi:hypothetical protein
MAKTLPRWLDAITRNPEHYHLPAYALDDA